MVATAACSGRRLLRRPWQLAVAVCFVSCAVSGRRSRCRRADSNCVSCVTDALRAGRQAGISWSLQVGAHHVGRSPVGCRRRAARRFEGGTKVPWLQRRKPQGMNGRKGDKVTISLGGEVSRSLAARFATLLSGASSPFVTQSQLMGLVKTDRSDIERLVRQAEWMMRHPRRGMPATPYLQISDWKRFLCWIDGAIQHLAEPRAVPELEHLIRTWQDRRGNIVAPTLRWRRRADVIAAA